MHTVVLHPHLSNNTSSKDKRIIVAKSLQWNGQSQALEADLFCTNKTKESHFTIHTTIYGVTTKDYVSETEPLIVILKNVTRACVHACMRACVHVCVRSCVRAHACICVFFHSCM